MTVFDFKCALCSQRVEDSPDDLTGRPCANQCCEGVLKKVYSFWLKPVQGGGGSPGRSVGG